MIRPPWTQALFGYELEGTTPMRFVYLDEAGTAAHEPVTVQAGVIVQPDLAWRAVETHLSEVIRAMVPQEFQEGFIFHATQLFSGGKYKKSTWSLAGRISLIQAYASVPRRFGIPIAMAMARRGRAYSGAYEKAKKVKMRPEEMDHCIAFLNCVAAVDKFLRERTPADEIAHLVVEDCARMRRFLQAMYQSLEAHPVKMAPGMFQAFGDAGSPDRYPEGVDFKISKIVDGPHFVGKKNAVMLHLADAVAFSLRAYLSKHPHSDGLIRALLARPFPLEGWDESPSSFATFYPPSFVR